MKKTVNNPSESSYNQTEELSNKADSIQFNNNINSNPINKMTTEKNTLLDIMRQVQEAAGMWANHEILCNEFRYGSGTLEDKCGIINAIAMQLYHLRAFSPKFYKDNPGFSESFKSLRNYNYAKRRAKEIHAKLQEEGRMY